MSPRQLELAFEEAPRWDACALESALAREAGRPLQVVVTDNRSVLLSVRRLGRTASTEPARGVTPARPQEPRILRHADCT